MRVKIFKKNNIIFFDIGIFTVCENDSKKSISSDCDCIIIIIIIIINNNNNICVVCADNVVLCSVHSAFWVEFVNTMDL